LVDHDNLGVMLGTVVCGGQSRRMGVDKGLLMSGTKTWAQIAKEKLVSLDISVVLSINEKQVEKYQSIFRSDELVIDAADLDVAGPLLGILSVHNSFPDEDLVIMACDMLCMETLVLKELLRNEENNKYEAIVFVNNNMVEPLCAIYSARGLAKILLLHKSNGLTRHSLKYVLEKLNTKLIDIDERWSSYFTNFNGVDDLKAMN
jgi:molybdopterin-guanine dinucleotide biosynthesis protein A